MFKIDLIVLFIIMGVLFVRQIMAFKNQYKIDYSSIILGIGVMGSLLHFIIQPQIDDLILLLRESFLPMIVSIFLYIVLTIVNQIQKIDDETQFQNNLLEQIDSFKNSLSILDGKIALLSQDEQKAQNEVIERLIVDIKALESIQLTQTKFLSKFDELSILYEDVSISFREFTELKMPELDSIIHKHIDILRIANQDHFNHLQDDLSKIVQSRQQMLDESKTLKNNLISITNISNDIALSINKTIMQQLKDFTKPLESKTESLKLISEAVLRDLEKSEERLHTIQNYNEVINREMSISSQKMREFEGYKDNVLDIFTVSQKLISEIEQIKTDYTKSQIKLEMIAGDFKLSETQQIEDMKKQIELLGEMLVQKKVTNEEITKNIYMLSQQNKIKNGYIVNE